jgi:glycosyltransferase involved in cell wall biosynthesis
MNPTDMPKLSVVMSVYNGERYLDECMQSILQQSFTNFEFIVINDGSTDNSLEILKRYQNSDSRICIINQSNAGLSTSLNRGIAIAKGTFIARMDADDISYPTRFEEQVKLLEHDSECVICGTQADIMDKKGDIIYSTNLETNWEDIEKKLPSNPFVHFLTMFRNEPFYKAGGYNEKIKHHFEDVLLWNKMALHGKLRNIDSVLGAHRLDEHALTNRNKTAQNIMNKMIVNMLAKDEISLADIALLKKITKNRPLYWKKSNYYLKVGRAHMDYSLSRKKAFLNLLMSLIWKPYNIYAIFNIFMLILPTSLIYRWKNARMQSS